MSDNHRYLIQRWFDNERTYTTTTIGAEDLTTTGAMAAAATTATLSSAWTRNTVRQLVTFSNSDQRNVLFTKDSTAISWQSGLSASATVSITTIGVQAYPIPPQVSKISNDTITVGQLVYTPAPVRSVQDWTRLNALPYTSDIPNNYFIYNGTVQFWPIPSTTGNIITFNYKTKVPDLNITDYTTGTLSSIAVGDTQITGVGTTWSSVAPLNTDLSFLNLALRITPPNGDGLWYPIQSFASNTSVILLQPIQTAPATTASAYTIGQLPLLDEDFHDMIVYGALKTYFTSIVRDADKFKLFSDLYQTRLELMKDYLGTKSINVNLGDTTVPQNPNLYIYASS